MPPDLLATAESVSLHDMRLGELRLRIAEATLALGLDSYTGEERLTLTCSGMEQFESLADPEAGLPGPAGDGAALVEVGGGKGGWILGSRRRSAPGSAAGSSNRECCLPRGWSHC